MYFTFFLSQNEREEFETEFKQKYEREKILLMEDNKKLSNELDKVGVVFLNLKYWAKYLESWQLKNIAGMQWAVLKNNFDN